MAQSTTELLTKNLVFAIHNSGTTKLELANALKITTHTFNRRLKRGGFSVGELDVIANLTGTSLDELIPPTRAAS